MSHRAILLAAIVGALASGAELRSAQIVVDSPFFALGGASAAHAAAYPLELRGIMTSGDAVSCCIYDRASGTTIWVNPGESGHSFKVTTADPAHSTATVEESGEVIVLQLHESRVLAATESPSNLAPEATVAYSVTTRRKPGEPRAPQQ